jgi:hypothetical protein
MKMNKIRYLLSLILVWARLMGIVAQTQPADQFITVTGRVIEMIGQASKPIANIKVEVTATDYDFTNEQGQFNLDIPASQKRVKIVLSQAEKKLITPFDGVIYLPPGGKDVELIVCQAENTALLEKIDALNTRVKKMDASHKLEGRQLAAVQRQLLDTLLFFEQELAQRDAQIAQIKVASDQTIADISAEKTVLVNEKAALQAQVNQLMASLADALEEKYLRQAKAFAMITLDLNTYTDAALNLRDALRPTRVNSYFSQESARKQLNTTIEKYNAARNAIVQNKEGQLEAIGHYWADPILAQEAQELYAYLEETVHQKAIYPMEFSVNDPLIQALNRQISVADGKRKAQAGSTEAAVLVNQHLDALIQRKTLLMIHLQTGM